MNEPVQLICDKKQKNDFRQRINPQFSEKKTHSEQYLNNSMCGKISSRKQLRVLGNVNKIENILDDRICRFLCKFVDKEEFYPMYKCMVCEKKKHYAARSSNEPSIHLKNTAARNSKCHNSSLFIFQRTS